MVLLSFSKKQFTFIGLQLAGFSEERIKSNKSGRKDWFKDKYYACPKTVKQISEDIQDPSLGDAGISNPDPADLLMALYFLKKYPTKTDLAGFLDITDKTALKRVWKYIEAIQALKAKKVRIDSTFQESCLSCSHLKKRLLIL